MYGDYVVVSHVPVVIEEGAPLIADSWYRVLSLVRDYFCEYFRRLVLVAPRVSRSESTADRLRPANELESFELIPSINARCRARKFWLRERQQWRRDVRRALKEASVMQTAFTDPLKPLQQVAFREARRQDIPTVLFGPDMDQYHKVNEGIAPTKLSDRIRTTLFLKLFDWQMIDGIRHADLVILKEGAVFNRYMSYGENVQPFCHTMHRDDQVISDNDLKLRLESLRGGRPLRLVYFGRLVVRKGIDEAIEAVLEARRAGVDVELTIFGDGPDKTQFEALVDERDGRDVIHFAGHMDYGDALFAELRTFDAILFMPRREDTPRMIFDGFAAGLPLIGKPIPFLANRARRDEPVELVNSVGEVAAKIQALDQDREQLASLAKQARQHGEHNTVEYWYRKRVAWVCEVLEKRGSPVAANQLVSR